MVTNVIKTRTPYTYQTLREKQLKSGSPEMQYDYYLWGDNKQVIVEDSDTVQVSDGWGRKIKVSTQEVFPYVSDGDEIGTAIKLFDVEIDNTPLDVSEFTKFVEDKTPLNYSPLRPLIPGEYEYQDAIVGVQMNLPPVEGRFGIIGSTLHVDVQDTVEKGTVSATSSGPSTVTLFKKFYNETKVLCNIVNASETAAIEITEIGLDSFKVGLKSLTNPSDYVSGTIDWLVDGY